MKTRWLFPILIIGLAILVVIEPPSPASGVTLKDAASATDPTGAGLELAVDCAEAPEAREAGFDSTAYGTY